MRGGEKNESEGAEKKKNVCVKDHWTPDIGVFVVLLHLPIDWTPRGEKRKCRTVHVDRNSVSSGGAELKEKIHCIELKVCAWSTPTGRRQRVCSKTRKRY